MGLFPFSKTVAAVVLALAAANAAADDSYSADTTNRVHPLVGHWSVRLPGTDCVERYTIRPDQTMGIVSGDYIAESALNLPAEPTTGGFYKWEERLTSHNGKPSCLGGFGKVGAVSTKFVLMNPSKSRFLLCETQDKVTCILLFVRDRPV